jgi:choline dehydrogenase
MAYQRGSKKTYDMWADLVGDPSYQWKSFLPYFKKSLDFSPPDRNKRAANATPEYDLASFGRGGGPLSVTFSNYAQAFASWVQKGLAEIGVKPISGFTSGTLMGSAYVLETIQASTQTRESSETGFLQPALKRGNLIVFQQSMAKKILFDGTKSATGVVVNTHGKEYILSAKKEVILSSGAFQSPQLLMVSGVGPAATLQKYGIPIVADRPGVGQNMWVSADHFLHPYSCRQKMKADHSAQDHIFMGPSYRVNVITGSALRDPQYAAQAIDDFNNKQAGILTNSGGDLFGTLSTPTSST